MYSNDSKDILFFGYQKLGDICCFYLAVCIQLNGADILCLSVSMVELTLTLLEVPGLAVVTLVLESKVAVARGLLQKCHAPSCYYFI